MANNISIDRYVIGRFFLALLIGCTINALLMWLSTTSPEHWVSFLNYYYLVLIFSAVFYFVEATIYLPYTLLVFFPITWAIQKNRNFLAALIFLLFSLIFMMTYFEADRRWQDNHVSDLSQYLRIFYTVGWTSILTSIIYPFTFKLIKTKPTGEVSEEVKSDGI